MSALDTILDTVLGAQNPQRPRTTGYQPQRVDAYPNLIAFHDPTTGPRPSHTSMTPNNMLPIRTKVSDQLLNKMGLHLEVLLAQSHAYYEEIDAIPAAAIGQQSIFGSAKHAYIIHPIQWDQAWDFSPRVLITLRDWIEGNNDLFLRGSNQILDFHTQRVETLRVIQKELDRRGIAHVGSEEGWLGSWEVVEVLGEEESNLDKPAQELDQARDEAAPASYGEDHARLDENEHSEGYTFKIESLDEDTFAVQQEARPMSMSPYGLAQADLMAMQMVENLKEMEYDRVSDCSE